VEFSEIARATNVYFMEHRRELIEEAWEHPVAQEYRHQERMRLARKAVISEIRDKGRKVSSIEPAEIRKLIDAYVKDHPEENVIKTFVCY
jgi:vacuolar-type H+-ATPase subunit C/Vma6